MLTIADITEAEIEMVAISAGGPGVQHVNKMSSAILLRFDLAKSSLQSAIKQKLLGLVDARVTGDGVIVIKAQKIRSQEKNRGHALSRPRDKLEKAQPVRKQRKATCPSKASVRRRLDNKRKRPSQKKFRGKVDYSFLVHPLHSVRTFSKSLPHVAYQSESRCRRIDRD